MASKTLRAAYRCANGAATLAALPTAFRRAPVRVFFGGARSGDGGGPLVKARLLQNHFPDNRTGFSLVYLLSNALYLPDIVISAIRARGLPIVLNQNGVFYPSWHVDWERENGRMAIAYHRADHVFWQSEFCRRCADQFLGPRRGAGEVLFNAVDVERYAPAVDRRHQGPFRLLVTGKIDEKTAYRLASSLEVLSAARRNGLDVVLHIAGAIAHDVESACRAQIDALGLSKKVFFSGKYSAMQAPDIYRSADAYLMMKHNDPCPNVVLEAMASGLPILYSASGGVPELVGDDAGVGLPVEESFERIATPSADAAAEGLSRLIANREAMALAARKRAVGKFALEAWIDRHRAVFETLVGGKEVTG